MSEMDIRLMRHGYDDHSYIDGLNDTSLTKDGVEEARLFCRHYSAEFVSKSIGAIALYSSSKRRAVETAEIFAEELDRSHIKSDITIDSSLKELYQGNMIGLQNMTHLERVRMLEIGWEIFERERLSGNNDYRYGTPDYFDPRYKDFNEFISPPFGESQNELSSRIEYGFLNLVKEASLSEKTPIFIAHRGTIREILNIAMSHNNGEYEIVQNPSIEIAGWRYCEMFETKLNNVEFSLGALKRNIYGDKK